MSRYKRARYSQRVFAPITKENRYKDFSATFTDYSWADTTTFSEIGGQHELTVIEQGTTIDKREGRIAKLKAVDIRLTFKTPAMALGGSLTGGGAGTWEWSGSQVEKFRILLVRKKTCVGDAGLADFNISEFLDDVASPDATFQSFYNRNTASINYNILYDQPIVIHPTLLEWHPREALGTADTDPSCVSYSGFERFHECHVDLSKYFVKYSEADTDGEDVEQGRIRLVIIRCTQPNDDPASDGPPTPECEMAARVTFIG